MRQPFRYLDHFIIELQHGLNACHVRPPQHKRPYPARAIAPDQLDTAEQKRVAGLMRINNAGEVAAQGLYRGQAFMARNRRINASMTTAAAEENEHLNWCQQRLAELNANRSKLDGFWYWGSFTIGHWLGHLVINGAWDLSRKPKNKCVNICKHICRSSPNKTNEAELYWKR